MSQSLKVLASCFIGAAIGTFVALEMSPMFWWVGLIVGFAVGYLAYEFKKVIAAIPKAWHAARGWQPNRWFWQNFFKLLPATSLFVSNVVIAVVVILTTSIIAEGKKAEVPDFIALSLLTVAVSIFFGSIVALEKLDEAKQDIYRENSESYLKRVRGRMLSTNPVHVYLWLLPRGIIRGIGWTLYGIGWMIVKSFTRIPISFKFWRIFFRVSFCFIHSEIRLLCGVDAAIGAAIGYFAGNVLIGGVAGALIGFLNFEVFSIRILKLVPRTASLFR